MKLYLIKKNNKYLQISFYIRSNGTIFTRERQYARVVPSDKVKSYLKEYPNSVAEEFNG